MNRLCLSLIATAALAATVTSVEVPVPYSVHIFLVPPIVQAKCAIGQFWYPDMVCSVCFCLTGGISRCGPRPGCDPNDFTTTTPATEDVAVHPGGAIIGVSGNNTTSNTTSTVAPDHSAGAVAATSSTTPPPVAMSSTTVTNNPATSAMTTIPTTTPTGLRLVARKSRSPRFAMFKTDDEA